MLLQYSVFSSWRKFGLISLKVRMDKMEFIVF